MKVLTIISSWEVSMAVDFACNGFIFEPSCGYRMIYDGTYHDWNVFEKWLVIVRSKSFELNQRLTFGPLLRAK
jgi:hypothetical protein